VTNFDDATTISTVRPEDLASVRDAVLDTAGPLAISGAGTAADWAGRLDHVDTVLDTTALVGVIQHNPGDMTVSLRAGTPLRALADELAPHGQYVAFDAARIADGATLGGLIATGDAGPGALVHGSLRDLVIGVTMVLADGTVARSGGHVIKNVAGYDLAKLLHGSYGTLAVLAEVVLRLHPVPKSTATLAVDCPLAEAAELATTVLGGPYEPAALEWISDSGSGPGSGSSSGTLLIRLDGTRDALPARMDSLRAAVDSPSQSVTPAHSPSPASGEQHPRPTPSDDSAVRPADSKHAGGAGAADGAVDPWHRHAVLTRGTAPGDVEVAVLRIGVRPSELNAVLNALPTCSITAGLGTGIATVTLAPGAVADAHAVVHAAGGTSVLRHRPAGADLPAWGPPPSALGVLKAIKAELDPDGRFGPGRFAPWIQS
jgi:glycolate oxidase FAD binding subunit